MSTILTSSCSIVIAPVGHASAQRRAAEPKAQERWERFAEVRGWGPVNDKPFVSEGHPPGRYVASVHVSPEARDAYLGLVPGSELPVGSVVAQFQQDPEGSRPGQILAMSKTAPSRSPRRTVNVNSPFRWADAASKALPNAKCGSENRLHLATDLCSAE